MIRSVLVTAASCLLLCADPSYAFSAATSSGIPPASTQAPGAVPSDEALPSPTHDVVRPLQQNWWPAALADTLQEDAPNAVEILNKHLVLWHDGDGWRCLDDMCAHRFAPLSEGRVIVPAESHYEGEQGAGSNDDARKRCLQCSYHGWDFNGQGSCLHIPQAEDAGRNAAKVKSYPVREESGILWVWPDASEKSRALAEREALPISPMLRQWEKYYPLSAYQRDLPYGYELLGENVIDMAHLPWSHHGIISFREGAAPLKLKMLSKAEKEQVWKKESSSRFAARDAAHVLPTFQAELLDAHLADPIFHWNYMGAHTPDENSTSHIAFYAPSHVRYHRTPASGLSSTTELFMCPQSTGKTRVIIFNPMEVGLPEVEWNEDPDSYAMLGHKKPNRVVKSVKAFGGYIFRNFILKRAFSLDGHMRTSDVFDGDNVFLAQMGDRLSRNRLGHKDYMTPTSADILSNAFRRWLDVAANASRKAGDLDGSNAADAATAGSAPSSAVCEASRMRPSRMQLLDRYESHTKDCKVCSKALQKLERQSGRLSHVVPALSGMVGASIVAVAASLVTETKSLRLLKVSGIMLASSILASLGASKRKDIVERKISRFYFVDHVSQEKE